MPAMPQLCPSLLGKCGLTILVKRLQRWGGGCLYAPKAAPRRTCAALAGVGGALTKLNQEDVRSAEC